KRSSRRPRPRSAQSKKRRHGRAKKSSSAPKKRRRQRKKKKKAKTKSSPLLVATDSRELESCAVERQAVIRDGLERIAHEPEALVTDVARHLERGLGRLAQVPFEIQGSVGVDPADGDFVVMPGDRRKAARWARHPHGSARALESQGGVERAQAQACAVHPNQRNTIAHGRSADTVFGSGGGKRRFAQLAPRRRL